jgi:hypothetical protein
MVTVTPQAIPSATGKTLWFSFFLPSVSLRTIDPSMPLVCCFCSQQAGWTLEDCGDCCPSRQRLGVNTCTYPTL